VGAAFWRFDLGYILWHDIRKSIVETLGSLLLKLRLMEYSEDIDFTISNNWELLWAPYDAPTYRSVLDQLFPYDIVLDIGAGDLRLARQMACITRRVYAIEINAGFVEQGLLSGSPAPDNLITICADALVVDFPPEITVAVLLMRHCTHFNFYAEKLKNLGCQRLITNARWRMGVETIALQKTRKRFEKVKIGWYACWCGAVGFKNGPVDLLTPKSDAIIHEVINCPKCIKN
jgi:hypothetical protein